MNNTNYKCFNIFNLRIFLFIFLLIVLININAFATSINSNALIRQTIVTRLHQSNLKATILGALNFLYDRQIRPRPGKHSPEYDSSDEGDGCKNTISLNLPFRENLNLPAPPFFKSRNRTGEWASYIHFMPNKLGFHGRAPLTIQDSNLFMTAFIGYPLFLFDETQLPTNKRYIDQMLKLAMKNVASFKRGNAFNFWAVLPGTKSSFPRTGPFNIPVSQLEMLAKAYVNPKFKRFFAILARGQRTPPKYWITECLNKNNNVTGADALFNIPNDADDTSTGVAFQALFAKRFPSSGIRPNYKALQEISTYRDINRTKEDGRDSWKGKNTGAYLTWLKDENKPVFDHPEQGVIPLGVNNVDIVVNSNVLFSLSFTGNKDLPGYKNCINLVVNAIKKHAWPEAGLYYPQNMIFPYAVTRAWRDGTAREGQMPAAMKILLKDLLKEQKWWGHRHPRHKGAFPGGDDKSDNLATALGVTALINIGAKTAIEENFLSEYENAIKSGVAYLIKTCKWQKPKNKSTIGVFATPKGRCATWESGLFFAASFWDLAHWRSQAFTDAMVLEALTKYVLAYDMDLSQIGARKLKLR